MFRTSQLLPYFTPIRTVYTVNSGWQQVAKANPDRAAIYFTPPAGVAVTLDFAPDNLVTQGALSSQAGETLALYWQYDGILVTLPWYWHSPGPGATLVVTELVWQPPTGEQV